MNRHFKDSQYYLRRAAATAKHGLLEELAPIRERVKAIRADGDEEPEDEGRFAALRGRAERAAARGRDRVRSVRDGTAE